MCFELILLVHFRVRVDDVPFLVSRYQELVVFSRSNCLDSVSVDSACCRAEDLSVPCEDFSLRCPSHKTLTFFDPLDGEQRMLLLVGTFSNKLWCGCLPIITWLVVVARKEVFAIRIVRQDNSLILHRVEICLSKVPVVVL